MLILLQKKTWKCLMALKPHCRSETKHFLDFLVCNKMVCHENDRPETYEQYGRQVSTALSILETYYIYFNWIFPFGLSNSSEPIVYQELYNYINNSVSRICFASSYQKYFISIIWQSFICAGVNRSAYSTLLCTTFSINKVWC